MRRRDLLGWKTDVSMVVVQVLLLSLLPFVSASSRDPNEAPAAEQAPLLFVGDRDYPPITYLDNGIAQGVDVDLAKALAKRLGRDIQIELKDWERAQEEVLTGKADGLLAMSVSEERAKQYDFTTPTFTHEFGLFIRRGDVAIRGVDDISGKRIGVTAGGFPRTLLEGRPDITLVLIETYEAGFDRLADGSIDAVAGDLWVVAYSIETHHIRGIAIAGEPFAKARSAIAVRKGNLALADEIDRAIRTLAEDGTISRIHQKWRPREVLFFPRERVETAVALAVGVFLLLLIAAMTLWVVVLKKQGRFRREVGEALRASEERYRRLMQMSSDGVWRIDFEPPIPTNLSEHEQVELILERGRLSEINEVGVKMSGRGRAEEILGRPAADFIAPTIAENIEIVTAYVRSGYRTVDVEARLSTRDGRLLWTNLNSFGIVQDGALTFAWGIRRDITERKRAEEALRESEQRFLYAFEHAAIGKALVAPDGRFIKVNRSLCNLVGYPEDELLTKTFQDITHPDDLEADLAFVHQMLAKEIQTYRMEKRYIHKSGGIVRVLLSVSLVWKDEENPLYFISEVEDITERKAAEENLRKSEERFSKFFMLSPVGMAVSSLPDGRLLDINQEFERMLGFGRSEAVGRTTAELGVWLDPKDREDVLARVRAEGKVKDVDLRVRAKQGNVVVQRFSAEPIEIDGRPCLLAAFADVTMQRKAEEELREYRAHLEELVETRTAELSAANRRLTELDRLKSMFIASMSHELRTPLNSIIGFAGMTLQGMSGDLNDEQKDNLTRAYHSAGHLLDLITDVIDISKIEAGRIEAYPEEFFLLDVVNDALATTENQLKEKGLSLTVDVPAGTCLNTDRKRLLQCLINLLSNAVKFTESGSITVASKTADGLVSISVSDTGIGIAEKDVHRLFQPFERMETHLRVKAGGTGLGLYLTKKLAVDILGGQVSVESVEGRGSTFTIVIPEDIGPAQKPYVEQSGGGIR